MYEQLKTRITKELEEFKKEWLEKPKEEIFNNAYKISIITDFEYLDFEELEDEQLETLLEQDNILEFIYSEWMDSDGYNTFGVLDEFFKYLVSDRI